MSGGGFWLDWVLGFEAVLRTGAALPAKPPPAPPPPAPGAPKALIFAPHPDDETITGALPLRLAREAGFAVTDVAVTLGSREERRAGRREELDAACRALGFRLLLPAPEGLSRINPETRRRDACHWAGAVTAIAAVLEAEKPTTIFLPHAEDWNSTHVGVHHLVADALGLLPGFACVVVETEYWRPMAAPNLLVESSASDVARLVGALALHAGEVARNPYHLRLPAWMMDNVRRGAELVGGQGVAAPAATFATLYRLHAWTGGGWRQVLPRGRVIGAADSLAGLFPAMS